MTALRTIGEKSVRLAQGTDGSFWMPPGVSTMARHVDWLFNFILAISVFFFLLIVVVMTLFVIRYRRRAGAGAEESAKHNTALELTWTIIPVILVAVIFFFGFTGYLDMSTALVNAYEILVDGLKWNWSFTYPNGYVDSNLHCPADRPVRLVMTSAKIGKEDTQRTIIFSLRSPQWSKHHSISGLTETYWRYVL